MLNYFNEHDVTVWLFFALCLIYDKYDSCIKDEMTWKGYNMRKEGTFEKNKIRSNVWDGTQYEEYEKSRVTIGMNEYCNEYQKEIDYKGSNSLDA